MVDSPGGGEASKSAPGRKRRASVARASAVIPRILAPTEPPSGSAAGRGGALAPQPDRGRAARAARRLGRARRWRVGRRVRAVQPLAILVVLTVLVMLTMLTVVYAKSTYCAHRLTVLAKLSTTHTRCVRRGLSLSLSLSVTEGSQAISHILYTVVRNRRRLGWSACPGVVELFLWHMG